MTQKSWDKLKIREGKPATDVPVHIVGLADADSERWDHVIALSRLYETGKIHSAASKAVPLIAELLQAETTPNKDTILVLLAATVCGSANSRLVWGLDLRRPEIKQFYARGTAREVWASTWQHRRTYVELLKHPDVMVRSGAAFLLAFDFEGASEVVKLVEEQGKRETEEKAKASFLLSLGLLRSYVPKFESSVKLAAIAEDESQPLLVRGAAVLAQLYASRTLVQLSETQTEVLVQWSGLVEVELDGYPWNNGITDMHCARVVEGRCEEGGLVAAEILAECIRRYGPHGRGDDWASGILALAFEEAAFAMSAGPFMIDANVEQATAFTERQKALLEVLASYSFRAPFLSYGIPVEVRDRRRWLGLDPPGILERVVTTEVLGKQRTWPVWLCMKVHQAAQPDERVPVEEMFGEVLTDLELLELRMEYSHNAYSLRLGGDVDKESLVRSQDLVPWALNYLKDMARTFAEFGGTLDGWGWAAQVAMNILIKEGHPEELLPAYDRFVHPSWRNIIAVLPLPRREALIVNRVRGTLFDDAETMWSAGVRSNVEAAVKNLALYPTEAVATALFDVRDHIVRYRFTEFNDVCQVIETGCMKITLEHTAFHAVVEQRLKRHA